MLVDPEELELAQPFSDIFPERADVVQAIEKKMAESGYDMAQPIVIWQREPGTNPVVVDGNQRCRAARKAKIQVGVFYQKFASEDEAVDYAISRQRDRRNLTDLELIRCIQHLDSRKTPGGGGEERGNQYKSGRASNDALPDQAAPLEKSKTKRSNKTANQTAVKVGTSDVTVERARYITAHAPEEYKQNMEVAPEGEAKPWSLHKTWKKTQEFVKAKKAATEQEAMAAPAVGKSSTPPPEIKRAVASVPLPKAGQPITDAEREFMSRIPLRTDFADERDVSPMDNDLRLYLMFEPRLKQMKEDVLNLVGPCSEEWLGPFHRAVSDLVNAPSPVSWQRCRKCDGEKVTLGEGTCKRCRGCGYRID